MSHMAQPMSGITSDAVTASPADGRALASARLVSGAPSLALAGYDLGSVGFTTEEFFVSGTACSFAAPDEVLGANGRWNVAQAVAAPFETRIVVVRPTEPEQFSGTVVVEWLNVSAGADMAPAWLMNHREIMRSGHVYVGVSCQQVGIEGGPSMGADKPLKEVNPERYSSLKHPGDAFAYDIYTQIARLLRAPRDIGLLGPLEPQRLLAVGESQSATYLVTYINAVDPISRVFDGFLIHSRGTSVGRLSGQSIFVGERMEGIRLREDLRVSAIVLQTETDLLALGGLAVRQPDNDKLRTWEIAGAAHADNYFLAVGMIDSGRAALERLAAAYEPVHSLMGMQLSKAVNCTPQHHYVAQAALHRLNLWVTVGEIPPLAPRLHLDPNDPMQFASDDDGNVIGGIRTPWCDVPIACSTGVGEAGTFAYLFGSSVRFDRRKLAARFALGAPQYQALFERALDASIEAGFILRADRTEIISLAELGFQSTISNALPVD